VGSKRLYVGNVPFGATEDELRNVFEPYGTVTIVDIVKDRETGRPRGFCFIDMENAEEAIEKVNGTDMGGRKLFVNEAREREKKPFNREPNYNREGANRSSYDSRSPKSYDRGRAPRRDAY